jgi:hypothetical protein
VAQLIGPDYSDSRHETKAQLIARCRQELDGPTIQTLRQRGAEIELSDQNATATLNLFVRFEQDSRVARQYKAVALARVRLYLGKRPDGTWLIDRVELLEVDQFPVSWRSL